MKTSNTETEAQTTANKIELALKRVEILECEYKKAKEQSREARRKRKEAKLLARSAKKQAKEAKAALAEARMILADAEAKLAKSNGSKGPIKNTQQVVPARRKRKIPPRRKANQQPVAVIAEPKPSEPPSALRIDLA